MTAGVFSLLPGDERQVIASEDWPLTVEVLSGRVDVDGEGPLSAGETTTLDAPTTITAETAATVWVRNYDNDEED
jgi:hypothetical protein